MKYFCRYAGKKIVGCSKDDNTVSAATPAQAAQLFWEINRRNHPLPQTVEVIDYNKTWQLSFKLQQELTVRNTETIPLEPPSPVDNTPQTVDNYPKTVDNFVEKLGIKAPLIHRRGIVFGTKENACG